MDVSLKTDRLSVSVDERGILHGRGPQNVLYGDVTVLYNGRSWATIPSCIVDRSHERAFRCDLPALAPGSQQTEDVLVLDSFGEAIASVTVQDRVAVTNGAGLAAKDVLDLHDRPFFAVPYLSFDGAVLTITGAHLPPAGDPSSLRVEFGRGVAGFLQYPIESASWESHFWYWPNARYSDFLVRIDLSASEPGSDPFSFRFIYTKGPQKDLPEPYGRVWIPRDLSAAIGNPQDLTQLTRVQTWSDTRSVTLTGFNVYNVVAALLIRYGVRRVGSTIMDWGCGHGRVARHFIREWPCATIIGIDVDSENAAWADEHLAPGHFLACPLMPPCDLKDGHLDAVFSISVMTHLTAEVQKSWLKELVRLLRPNGLAVITFGGPGAVSWSSIWNGPDYIKKWNVDGIHADVIDPALEGKIVDSAYYRNTAQTHEYVRSHWGKFFDVIEILPDAIGNLDVAVMRRRGR